MILHKEELDYIIIKIQEIKELDVECDYNLDVTGLGAKFLNIWYKPKEPIKYIKLNIQSTEKEIM